MPAYARIGLRLLAVATVLLECQRVQAQQEELVQVQVVAQQPVIPDEQFEQWVFQENGNAAATRKRLDAQLLLQVEDIDRTCQLTGAQKQKIQLMGRGDIKRFFDRYQIVRQKFQLIKHDQQKQQEIWQDINPLQMTLQVGLFHEESLLYKSLQHSLSNEQYARYEAAERERRNFRHRASIELSVSVLEQNVPLRETQRRDVIALLTKDTKPAKKSGPYDFYWIMYQLGRIPEHRVKSLFDQTQWKLMEGQLAQFKGMEAFLRQNGVWSAEDDDGDKPAARLPPRKDLLP